MAKIPQNDPQLVWHVHTPNLLMEVLNNPGTTILSQPINIFGKILALVAQRAIELNDPDLHALMLILTLYETGDPEHPEYQHAWETYVRPYVKKLNEKAKESKSEQG